MTALIKSTIKLMLRNKGALFFLLVTPIISTLILDLKVDNDIHDKKPVNEVIQLSSVEDRAIYNGDSESFIVKVYDGADTELSGYVLDTIAEDSMFSVCRADVTAMSYDQVRDRAAKDAYDDRVGMIMYLNEGFDDAVMNDSLADGMELFRTSDDQREELFTDELTALLSRVYRAGTVCGGDVTKTIDMLTDLSGHTPAKHVTDLAGKDEVVLTERQADNKTQIGYAFAFITLGSMFSGVFAAHTVIRENSNKVFTRIMLTGTSTVKYFASKFVVVFLMCLIQTVILAVCLMFVKGLDLGIPLPVFLLVVFLLENVLGTFSLLTGILFGDIMSSNYAAFAIWSISAMLSGLLFPIDGSSRLLQSLSYLMPQRWFIDASERLIAGISGAYPLLLTATAAYLIVIVSIGSVGLKMKWSQA